MAGTYGIVETRDIILLFKALVVRVIKENRVGGFSPEDLRALLGDPQILADFATAVAGSDRVSKELKELDFMDGVELSKFVYGCAAEIVSELKG